MWLVHWCNINVKTSLWALNDENVSQFVDILLTKQYSINHKNNQQIYSMKITVGCTTNLNKSHTEMKCRISVSQLSTGSLLQNWHDPVGGRVSKSKPGKTRAELTAEVSIVGRIWFVLDGAVGDAFFKRGTGQTRQEPEKHIHLLTHSIHITLFVLHTGKKRNFCVCVCACVCARAFVRTWKDKLYWQHERCSPQGTERDADRSSTAAWWREKRPETGPEDKNHTQINYFDRTSQQTEKSSHIRSYCGVVCLAKAVCEVQ